MKAVRIHTPGGRDALVHEDVEPRLPGKGEALVRVRYAGLNFIDVYHRSGLYPLPLPAILGNEGMGVVEAVGDGVHEVEVGQRVAWAMQLGSYAEQTVVPAWKLVPVPDDVGDDLAAAVMLQGMTAHYLATSTYPLTSGDTCLVHAAAGGVGQLLVQLAKLRGARVIATAGSDSKADLAREAGADEVILYRDRDFAEATRELTGGQGVQVVYDSVGRDTFRRGLDVLRPRGTMVLFGASSGPVEPFDLQLLNQKGSLFVTRPSLGHYTLTREELLERSGDLFSWIAQGSLRVRVDQVFELADAGSAHDYIEGRNTKGKVLLRVG